MGIEAHHTVLARLITQRVCHIEAAQVVRDFCILRQLIVEIQVVITRVNLLEIEFIHIANGWIRVDDYYSRRQHRWLRTAHSPRKKHSQQNSQQNFLSSRQTDSS